MSRLKPALTVFLLAFAAIQPLASAQNGPARSAKPLTYPTAREILDRSVRATGGMNAWLKLTSLSWKADVTDEFQGSGQDGAVLEAESGLLRVPRV
jgi:hypothetical protein